MRHSVELHTVGEVVVVGPFVPASILEQTRQQLQSAFQRKNAKGKLVVQLRSKDSVTEFEVALAFVESGDSHDVRDLVGEALGLLTTLGA